MLTDHIAFRDFRHKVRVAPSTFDKIVEKLQGHSIFTNNSNNPQTDVWIQVAITLNRFGHYGNAATTRDIGDWAGVSAGTVDNATKRVAIALLSLHDEHVKMPTAMEKKRSKRYSFEKTKCPKLRHGFLSADGSTFPVFEKPARMGEAYYDRSSRYSFNTQVRKSN